MSVDVRMVAAGVCLLLAGSVLFSQAGVTGAAVPLVALASLGAVLALLRLGAGRFRIG